MRCFRVILLSLLGNNRFYKRLFTLLVLLTVTIIIIGLERDDENSIDTEFIDYIPSRKARIFCIITTQPENFYSRVLAVNNTWVSECDDHRFISIIPDIYKNNNNNCLESGPIEISFPFRVLQPTGHVKEDYNMLTGKVNRSIS